MRNTLELAFLPVRIRDVVRSSLPRRCERLRVSGDPIALARPAVAIVGTRAADPEALVFAHRLACDLAGLGIVVVSGGAFGIDAAAHRGALEAGGLTVVVVAGGLDHLYPAANRGLFECAAAQGGLVVSAYDDDAQPLRGRFLERNALIAALSDAVIVVQAPHASGAMSTATAAFTQRKQVFIVPHSPWDERGAGGMRLLASRAVICTSARSVLSVPALADWVSSQENTFNEEIRDPSPDQEPQRPPLHAKRVELSAPEVSVMTHLSSRARTVDELCHSTGMQVSVLQTALLGLLLKGSAVERSPGRYAKPT